MELDKYQLAAVHTDKPYVLIAAQAGSGKTRVIKERIKFLLANGYEAKNIYAITFTNAAAEEMRSRINGNADCYIGTIHGLANRILLQNGIDTNWIVQTENFDLLFEKIEDLKEELIFPQVDYLLIDEFQDICDNEYNFMFNILRPREYMAVGDSAQSIYSFKGSNFTYFMDLIKNPQVQVYELNNCYRCGYEIIEFAENFLFNVNDIYKIPAYCATGEMGNVVKENFSIDTLLSEVQNSQYNYKDIFILVRSNKEIEEIKSILNLEGIPCDTFKKADLDNGSLNELLNKNTIKVLTVHSAKGLEAKKVIVCAFKLWNNEERRLAYVAATRAAEELIWLSTRPKPRRGKKAQIQMLEW